MMTFLGILAAVSGAVNVVLVLLLRVRSLQRDEARQDRSIMADAIVGAEQSSGDRLRRLEQVIAYFRARGRGLSPSQAIAEVTTHA